MTFGAWYWCGIRYLAPPASISKGNCRLKGQNEHDASICFSNGEKWFCVMGITLKFDCATGRSVNYDTQLITKYFHPTTAGAYA
jgi:hypothetical protein